ncbi:nucleotidyltransferase family protein [Rhodopila sp.]|uniref:nucleotidyltransferase family protein n=1 Tax=Rhodopila sp. TaxID=2480087 RepID=UPI003D0C0CDF
MIHSTYKWAMKTSDNILPANAASRLADYKRAVMHALPGVEKLILFGSRARGEALPDSDYDVAVLVHDLWDSPHIRRVLSDLAYDDILSGFVIRPIPLPADYLTPPARRTTELADDIIRDGVELT